MSTPDNPWKLSEADNERIFRTVIAPRAMDGVHAPEQPALRFIGGQAASGKTTAQRSAQESLGSASGVIADFDALLEDHPAYAQLLAQDDRTAAVLAGGDAYVWMNKVIDLAEHNRVNLIREGAMGGGSTARESDRFHAAGYRVEADVMAVAEPISRLAILHRYQSMREELGHGRLVATSIHDDAYNGIPRTLQSADDQKFLDSVRLHRWGGGVVYENQLGADGQWARPAESVVALDRERNRPLDPREVQWLQEKYRHLDQTLPSELRPELSQVAVILEKRGVSLDDSGAAAIRIAGPSLAASQRRQAPAQRSGEPPRVPGTGGPQLPGRPSPQQQGQGRG